VPQPDPITGVPQYNPAQSSPAPQAPPAAPGATGGVGIDGFGPITSNYLRAFNASIASQRSSIDTQLAQALGELGQRRNAAAGVIAGLPGAVGTNAAQAGAGLAQAGQAATAGLDPGAAAAIPTGVPQLQAGIKGVATGYSGMAPLLNLANMANSQGGEALLNSSADQAQDALGQQQQQFLQQLALQQLQTTASNDQYAQHAAIDDKYRLGDLAAQNAATQQNTADTAAQAAGLQNAAQLTSIQNSPAYKFAVQAMTTGLYNNSVPNGIFTGGNAGAQYGGHAGELQKQSGAQIAKMYSSNPTLLYALLAGGHLTQADLVSAGVSAPAPAPAA
jgi:hypothetical protein